MNPCAPSVTTANLKDEAIPIQKPDIGNNIVNQTPHIKVGVIGGSGVYGMDTISNVRDVKLTTSFGDPSDAYIVGELGGFEVAFLARHGRGHHLLPSDLNFRANVMGFKMLGITHLISVTAVGSLREHLKPKDIVIPDQLVDRTFSRESTFFGNGIAAHVPFSDPFCSELSDLLFDTATACDATVHKGGTLVTMEGPAFSTRAESHLYRSWGMDIIGMTAVQEAKLCREAEICYGSLAMVTDYDCWHDTEEEVSVEAVIAVLKQNVSTAQAIIESAVPRIAGTRRSCACGDSLNNAIMTRPESISTEVRERLAPIIGRYI